VDLAAIEATALRARTDTGIAALRVEAADAATSAAGVALRPRLSFEGGYEWNGGSWASRTSSWVAGIRADWTWSFGDADAAHLRAANRAAERARAERASVESAARLDIRTALARVEAARARHDVGQLAVGQARESKRILRDRYDAGLVGITELLRAATALLDAESLDAGARGETAVAGALLDRALGRLPAAAPPE
jgi:outer membrane protein TolC